MQFGSISRLLHYWEYHTCLAMWHLKLSCPLIRLLPIFLTLYLFGYVLQWLEKDLKGAHTIWVVFQFHVVNALNYRCDII